jgi:hypothetical protein
VLLQDLLVGAGLGSMAGRLIAHRLERSRGKELPAMRVRQIEAKWIVGGMGIGLLSGVLLG